MAEAFDYHIKKNESINMVIINISKSGDEGYDSIKKIRSIEWKHKIPACAIFAVYSSEDTV